MKRLARLLRRFRHEHSSDDLVTFGELRRLHRAGAPSAAPPVRLAMGDPHFASIRPWLRILLDGKPVERCTAYDLDAQTVTRQRLQGGHLFVDPETDAIAVETIRGKVEVRWK